MKILHTADWHIDANIIEAGRCLQFMVDRAHEIQPDLIVISGDMFNSADVRLDSEAARLAMRTVTALKAYSKYGVVILIGTPSHDGLAAKIFDGIPKVMVEDKPRSIIFDTIGEGYDRFVVSCLPQPTKQYLESVAAGDIEDVNRAMSKALTSIFAGFGSARAQYPDGPHICLGHFTVRGAKISPTQQMIGYDIEMSSDQLALADPSIWCLGHIHHSQEVAPGAFYSGSIYRVDFGERESVPGFYIHKIISEFAEIESVFVPTPASSMSKLGLDLRADAPAQTFAEYEADARKFINEQPIADKMQVEVKCYADEADKYDLDVMKNHLIARGAKEVEIIIQRLPRPNVRSAKILAVESLREKLLARAEITDENVAAGVLEKADLVETMKADAVLNIIKQKFMKGGSK
jgi:DNA repair exonuclease SbcCD nuclease subunit